MTRRTPAVLAAALALSGCASTSDDAFERSSKAMRASLVAAEPDDRSETITDCGHSSWRPTSAPPIGSQMPAGDYVHEIIERGRLIVGVDQNTVPLAYFNPRTRTLEGFEIDLVKAIGRAIFGTDDPPIEFRAISTPQRIPLVRDGAVDLVADAIVITCARQDDVAFSDPYYQGDHTVLVAEDSPITTLKTAEEAPETTPEQRIAGKRVCASRGSISIGLIEEKLKAIPDPAELRTDCLVALQKREVDAISTSATFIHGFMLQDPRTRLVDEPYTDGNPVGMAINKQHRDFVRFVNAVLGQARRDGTWQESYDRWLDGVAAVPPEPTYVPEY